MAKKTKPSLLSKAMFRRELPVLAVLAAIVIVGSASATIASLKTNNARNVEIALPASLEGVVSIDEIRTKAIADVPGGTIIGIELEEEEGVLVYKVKFSDGTTRSYNAKTGELYLKSSSDDDQDETVPANFVAGITMDQARAIAQGQRPGKAITKIELESEHGVVVYSVRFSDDGRVDVNATDGSVMRVRDASGNDSFNASDDDSSSSNDDSDEDDSSDDDSNDGSEDSGSNSGSGSDDDSEDESDDD